jgi:hypothetical protein
LRRSQIAIITSCSTGRIESRRYWLAPGCTPQLPGARAWLVHRPHGQPCGLKHYRDESLHLRATCETGRAVGRTCSRRRSSPRALQSCPGRDQGVRVYVDFEMGIQKLPSASGCAVLRSDWARALKAHDGSSGEPVSRADGQRIVLSVRVRSGCRKALGFGGLGSVGPQPSNDVHSFSGPLKMKTASGGATRRCPAG